MALTDEQIEDFRDDIGDNGEPPAFSNTKLQRLFTRAGENYNQAVLKAIDQLLGNSWTFNDYTQNESQEKKQQIFENLRKLRAIWQAKVDEDAQASSSQIILTGMRTIPGRKKSRP
ncbi:MAG: hypothetical protein K8L99_13470 [Anaerolineae bacterium]|nr:hypothetical protein [Anaerolineae bacterium]